MLLISSQKGENYYGDLDLFQSRNRGSFDFNLNDDGLVGHDPEFQSRNRGSFGFNVVMASYDANDDM